MTMFGTVFVMRQLTAVRTPEGALQGVSRTVGEGGRVRPQTIAGNGRITTLANILVLKKLSNCCGF